MAPVDGRDGPSPARAPAAARRRLRRVLRLVARRRPWLLLGGVCALAWWTARGVAALAEGILALVR